MVVVAALSRDLPGPDDSRIVAATFHRDRIAAAVAGTFWEATVISDLDEILSLLRDAEREADRMTALILEDDETREMLENEP